MKALLKVLCSIMNQRLENFLIKDNTINIAHVGFMPKV